MTFFEFDLLTWLLWSILSLFQVPLILFVWIIYNLNSSHSKAFQPSHPFQIIQKMRMEWKICIFMWLNHSSSEKCVVQYNSKSTQKKHRIAFVSSLTSSCTTAQKWCVHFLLLLHSNGHWWTAKCRKRRKKSLQLATLFVNCTHYLFVYDTERDVHAHYCLWWFTRQSH